MYSIDDGTPRDINRKRAGTYVDLVSTFRLYMVIFFALFRLILELISVWKFSRCRGDGVDLFDGFRSIQLDIRYFNFSGGCVLIYSEALLVFTSNLSLELM